MPAVRGRGLGVFGQVFWPLGISGSTGAAPSVIVLLGDDSPSVTLLGSEDVTIVKEGSSEPVIVVKGGST